MFKTKKTAHIIVYGRFFKRSLEFIGYIEHEISQRLAGNMVP